MKKKIFLYSGILCTYLSIHPAAQKPVRGATHNSRALTATTAAQNKSAIPPHFNISQEIFDSFLPQKQRNLTERFIQYNLNNLQIAFSTAIEHNLFWAIAPLLKKDRTIINTGYKNNFPPLILAIKHHHIDMAKQLLEYGALPDICDRNYNTALICASANGQTKIVEQLLACGAKIDAASDRGTTALSAAVIYNKPEIFDMLTRRGATINSGILKIAINNRDTQFAQKIIDSYRAQLHRQHPSTFAGYTTKQQLFTDFLEEIFRINFNICPAQERTIYESFMMLLEHASKQGHIIETTNNSNALKFLMQHDLDLEEAFIDAAQNNMVNMIPFLTEHGAHNDMHQNEWTALVEATKKGHVQMVDMLVGPSGNIDTKNIGAWTPLMIAAGYNQPELVQHLLEKKADIHAVDEDGRSALLWAAQKKNIPMMALLLAYNADIFSVDRNGSNALTFALNHGDLEGAHAIVNLLRTQLAMQPEDDRHATCPQLNIPESTEPPLSSHLYHRSHESTAGQAADDLRTRKQEQFERFVHTGWQQMCGKLPDRFTHLAQELLSHELEHGHLVVASHTDDTQNSVVTIDSTRDNFVTPLLEKQAPPQPPKTILKNGPKPNASTHKLKSPSQQSAPDSHASRESQSVRFLGTITRYTVN